MCLNCGCGELDNRHDNDANIVADDVRRAAEASGQDLRTTVHNMEDALGKLSQREMASTPETTGASRS